MKLSQVAWRTVGGAALKEYRDDDIPGLATEMAYWIAFSIFPFLIFLATLTGLVAGLVGGPNLYDAIERDALSALPPATADALREPARIPYTISGTPAVNRRSTRESRNPAVFSNPDDNTDSRPQL